MYLYSPVIIGGFELDELRRIGGTSAIDKPHIMRGRSME